VGRMLKIVRHLTDRTWIVLARATKSIYSKMISEAYPRTPGLDGTPDRDGELIDGRTIIRLPVWLGVLNFLSGNPTLSPPSLKQAYY